MSDPNNEPSTTLKLKACGAIAWAVIGLYVLATAMINTHYALTP